MKNLGFKKRNLIALTLAAVLAVSGFGAYKTQAAGRIDEKEQCKITVQIPTATVYDENDHDKIKDAACLYEGDINISLYKIADVDLGGKIVKLDDSSLDISILEKSEIEASKLASLADSAYKYCKGKKHETLTINPSKTTKASVNVERGIYLYVVEGDVKDSRYEYSFTKSIISVPSSNYIQGATKVDENGNIVKAENSDSWLYDVTFALKCEAKARFGYLNITKSLKTHNQSLGTASFVFNVKAELDNKTVFENVYSLDFDSAKKLTTEDIKLPAGSKVTVTEVYSGGSYEQVVAEGEKAVKTVEIKGEETKNVDFTNDYDEKLIVGGISAVNHFEQKDGKISWENADGQLVDQTTGSTEGGN